MDDLEATIKRLTEAEAGSPELDWAIAEAIGWTKFWSGYTFYLPPGAVEGDERQSTEFPAFSRSIDAALTLRTENWSWRVGNLPSGRGFADIGTQQTLQCIEGATPALALCIAALRSRSLHTSGDGE